MTSIISAARSAIRSVTGTERSDDGFGGTLRRAPDWLDPRYDEGGEDAYTPWWQTPFLEVPATERRRGPRGRRDADDDDDDHDDHDDHDHHDGHDDDDRFYVGDEPLWPTLSHVVLMSFALRQMVRALERHDDGEKLGDSCVVNMTVAQLLVPSVLDSIGTNCQIEKPGGQNAQAKLSHSSASQPKKKSLQKNN